MPFAINSAYVLQKVAQRGDRAYQINRASEELKSLQEQAGMMNGGGEPADSFEMA